MGEGLLAQRQRHHDQEDREDYCPEYETGVKLHFRMMTTGSGRLARMLLI